MPKFQTHTVTGKITSHGTGSISTSRQGQAVTTYSTITLVEDGTGDEIQTNPVIVSDKMDKHIFPGSKGTFVISKVAGSRMLSGFRNHETESIDMSAASAGMAISFTFLFLFVGFILCVTGIGGIIGLPMILYGLWVPIKTMRSKKKLTSTLRDAGFDFTKTRTI